MPKMKVNLDRGLELTRQKGDQFIRSFYAHGEVLNLTKLDDEQKEYVNTGYLVDVDKEEALEAKQKADLDKRLQEFKAKENK